MKKVFKKIKEFFKKEDEESKKDYNTYGIVIEDSGTNAKIFDEAVDIFCMEIHEKLGLKLNKNYFIKKSKLKNDFVRKFVFPIPSDIPDETKLLVDVIKKNVQLKIKGSKRFKNINVIGFRTLKLDSSEIPRLWEIINLDAQLQSHRPLFLNLQVRFYTSIFDYDRFVNFAKHLDKYLDLDRLDYDEVRRRIRDSVEGVIDDMHRKLSKESDIKKNRTKEIAMGMAEQGAIKLIYIRSFAWDIDDLKEKPRTYLNKLANLFRFMQVTLDSTKVQQDYLMSLFELSTNLDLLSAYGCYATINDKQGIDESILLIKLPDNPKEI